MAVHAGCLAAMPINFTQLRRLDPTMPVTMTAMSMTAMTMTRKRRRRGNEQESRECTK